MPPCFEKIAIAMTTASTSAAPMMTMRPTRAAVRSAPAFLFDAWEAFIVSPYRVVKIASIATLQQIRGTAMLSRSVFRKK